EARPGEIQVGNLVYAKTKTSKCFSEAFMTTVAKRTAIPVASRYTTVHSGKADELARVGFAIMTGEGAYTLAAGERDALRDWMDRGGFLLASASCSSPEWSASFRREIERIFGAGCLVELDATHPVFSTLHDLSSLPTKHEGNARFYGVIRDGRLACLFSPEGLNDTANVAGCCCCGGNEVKDAQAVVANAFVYALVE
ncbi:MAG: hypothetical protein RLZZ127_3295, partial [Planctomycetota bacterium]